MIILNKDGEYFRINNQGNKNKINQVDLIKYLNDEFVLDDYITFEKLIKSIPSEYYILFGSNIDEFIDEMSHPEKYDTEEKDSISVRRGKVTTVAENIKNEGDSKYSNNQFGIYQTFDLIGFGDTIINASELYFSEIKDTPIEIDNKLMVLDVSFLDEKTEVIFETNYGIKVFEFFSALVHDLTLWGNTIKEKKDSMNEILKTNISTSELENKFKQL
jgi:hypothetical protein